VHVSGTLEPLPRSSPGLLGSPDNDLPKCRCVTVFIEFLLIFRNRRCLRYLNTTLLTNLNARSLSPLPPLLLLVLLPHRIMAISNTSTAAKVAGISLLLTTALISAGQLFRGGDDDVLLRRVVSSLRPS
jgi:hypothetical protein